MTPVSRRNRLRLSLTVLSLTSLSACGTVSSNCGTLFTYSPEFQREAASELDYLANTGQYPNVVTMVQDYGVTRETIRVCK